MNVSLSQEFLFVIKLFVRLIWNLQKEEIREISLSYIQKNTARVVMWEARIKENVEWGRYRIPLSKNEEVKKIFVISIYYVATYYVHILE